MATATSQQKNNYFSDDFVLPIVTRLPVKSLSRFKSVSNSWGNLISSPSFRDMHQKQSKKNPNLLFWKTAVHHIAGSRDTWSAEWKSFNPKTLSLGNNFTTRCKVFNMMVTCQGVVCFLGTKDGNETQVFLYSPGAKELLALPVDSSSRFSRGPIVGLGIGYLSSTKKYKVVLLFLKINQIINPLPRFKCQVFEVSNGSGGGSRNYFTWRVVEEDVPYPVDCFHSPAFVEDTIYWKARSNDLVVSFNIKNDKFETINYPNRVDSSVTKKLYLVELQGKLGLAEASRIQAFFTMVIWKLQDHGGCIWEKGYTISLTENEPNCLELMRPIYVQGEVLIMYSEGCILFYNLRKNAYKLLDVPVDLSPVGMYHESLFSIGTI